jgi:hypothetical protein
MTALPIALAVALGFASAWLWQDRRLSRAKRRRDAHRARGDGLQREIWQTAYTTEGLPKRATDERAFDADVR